MSFGSKNNRKKIIASITEEADGSTILGQINTDIITADNRSRGEGTIAVKNSLSDTSETISSMRRSLGERQAATNKTINEMQKSNGKPSLARDWITFMTGQKEADDSEVASKKAEILSNAPAVSREALTVASLAKAGSKGLGSRPSESNSSTVEFIAGFENNPQDSFRAYWDTDHWSIGFGTPASGEDEVITLAQAQDRLASETDRFQGIVEKHQKEHNYDWNDNQVAALTSFAFNLGETNLKSLTDNGSRDIAKILAMIPSYNKADGKVLEGLVKRRASEANLFSTQP